MKQIIFALLVIAPALFYSADSRACTCTPLADNFEDTIAEHNRLIKEGKLPPSAELRVVKVKVLKYLQERQGSEPTEMLLSVIENLDGPETQDEIVVEGDDGFQCRPYVTQFKLGKTYLMAINQLNDIYYISVCGKYYKRVYWVQ